MRKEHAEKLYRLSQNGYEILYNSPYVAQIGTGVVEKDGDGFTYRDGTVVEIDVLDCDATDFDVYERFDDWDEDYVGLNDAP